MIGVVSRCGSHACPVPCACVTCHARYDYTELRLCNDCEERHLCPRCGEPSHDAVVFLSEPVVEVPRYLAAHVRATVWGRPN